MGRRKKAVKELSQLATMLTELRLARQLSMKNLSQATGISIAYISRIESGERHPSRELLLQLIEVLMPLASQLEKDRVMLAGGFAPSNYRNFMGREEVASLYQSIAQKDPDDFKNFIALVLLYIRSGQHEKALQEINQGLTRFNDKVQLCALMAALELSKENYEQAIDFQTDALKAFLNRDPDIALRLKQNDLLLSRGIIYFEAGNSKAYKYQSLLLDQTVKQAESHKDKALEYLHLAAEDFKQALSLGEDVYVLDELARVYFTFAFLLDEKDAVDYWSKSVESFEKTIYSNDKASLGYQSLIQSTAFLALAYAKKQEYQRAWFTLNIMEACLPNYWLIHYMKALYHVMLYKTENKTTLLRSALDCLKIAAGIPDQFNRTCTEARVDMDFEVLRVHYADEFEALLGQSV